MKRRSFIQASTITGLGLPFVSFPGENKSKSEVRDVFSIVKNKTAFYINTDVKPSLIFHITDTHLALDDERGNPYKGYSKRMAGAYKTNIHFESGKEVSCSQSFSETLIRAKEQQADFLILTGDIFSFPSEAAVEWATGQLEDTGIPYAYIAGNHDWHYEGLEGNLNQLRETWVNKRLKPLYQGKNPLFTYYDLNGVRIVCIDDSTYEILPEQLDFFREQVESGKPLLLCIHIPLYMPGHNIYYGCANPEWGEKSDKGYKAERREKWPKEGHTETTFTFYKEAFEAPNLLGIFAGHTHQPAVDVKNDIPQIVSGPNTTGYFTEIKIQKGNI